MRGDILPLPQYAFMAGCLVKHRDNLMHKFTLLARNIIYYVRKTDILEILE
jgi:hypothetical protein